MVVVPISSRRFMKKFLELILEKQGSSLGKTLIMIKAYVTQNLIGALGFYFKV